MVTNYNHLLSISHEPGFVLRVCVSGRFSRVQLFETLWTVAHQNPLSMGFSRQEYWRGFHALLQLNLPDPGIEPMSLASPALTGRFLTPVPPGKPGEALGDWFPISH